MGWNRALVICSPEIHFPGLFRSAPRQRGFRATILVLTVSLPCWTASAQEIVSATESTAVTSTIGAIPWYYVYADGIREASAQKKPVFLDFFASWCGPCKMMEAQTFTDPGVIGMMKDFVAIKVDTDQDPSTAFSYRVSGIPRYILLNIHREVIADQVGFVESAPFMQFLEDAKKVAYKKSDGTLINVGGSLGTPKGPPPIEITEATTREKLFEHLASPDPDLRSRATDELVRRKSDDLMKALADSLRDPYLGMRIAAWKALTKMEEDLKVEFDPWAVTGERALAVDRVTSGLRK